MPSSSPMGNFHQPDSGIRKRWGTVFRDAEVSLLDRALASGSFAGLR